MTRAAAWAALGLPGARWLAAQDSGSGRVHIAFRPEPGIAYRMDETTISTYALPDGRPVERDRGGMFHYVYDASVRKRFADGNAHCVVESTRGNGVYWSYGEDLVAWDSADPKGRFAPASAEKTTASLLRNARRTSEVSVDARGRIVEVWEGWRNPPRWMQPWDSVIVGDVQRLFLPLPSGPVRPGATHRGWLRVDFDPISSGRFANDTPYPIGVRFEGVSDGRARFSVRGGAVRSRMCRYYMRAFRRERVWKWVNRVEVEGIVDVDIETGWIVARDQTTVVRFDKIRTDDRGKCRTTEIENRRKLIVEAERLS